MMASLVHRGSSPKAGYKASYLQTQSKGAPKAPKLAYNPGECMTMWRSTCNGVSLPLQIYIKPSIHNTKCDLQCCNCEREKLSGTIIIVTVHGMVKRFLVFCLLAVDPFELKFCGHGKIKIYLLHTDTQPACMVGVAFAPREREETWVFEIIQAHFFRCDIFAIPTYLLYLITRNSKRHLYSGCLAILRSTNPTASYIPDFNMKLVVCYQSRGNHMYQ